MTGTAVTRSADDAKPRTRPASRRHKDRVAVIDIGSNSIRLVVFEGRRRVPTPFFNEKVICALGRDLGSTGALSEEGVEMALVNLRRFTHMAEGMGISEIGLLATAAAREASNGAAFIAEVEQQTGYPVRLLSGAEEARISAMGVLAGLPDARGIMGDLGGGSLELVELHDGEVGRSMTLPLGPLRLMELTDGDLAQVSREIEKHLASVDWLTLSPDHSFYAVGGAWRALARIMMDQTGYPLHVIHGFTVPRGEVDETMRVLSRQSRNSLAQMASVSRRRIETVPYAAALLRAVLNKARAKRVIWSSYGLREGYLFEQLPAKERKRDPLITTAQDLAREGRFPRFGREIIAWTDHLFPREEPSQVRLRHAACYLSDLAWREHPDYRARQALWRILHLPFAGADHEGRAFLAYAVFSRYGGAARSEDADPALALLGSKDRRRARTLGLAARLAYRLSAGIPNLLARTSLKLNDGELLLLLPDDGTVPLGEAVERRFNALIEAAQVDGGFIDWK